MLSYSLENFKSFGSKQKIPLKPITLIYGANSSGKSSVIHGYLFIRELLKTGKCDLSSFTIGGELLDLGGYKQYLHKKEYAKSLNLEVEIDKYKIYLKISAEVENSNHLKDKAFIESLKVENISENYSFEFIINKITKEFFFNKFNDNETLKNQFKINIREPIENQFPELDEKYENVLTIIFYSLKEIFDQINSNYENIVYLGPIRLYPTRDISLTNELLSDDMEYNAWNIVKKNKEIRDKVNNWLGGDKSKLNTKYKLSVEKLVEPSKYLENFKEIFCFEKFDDLSLEFIRSEGLMKEDFESEDKFKLYIMEKWMDNSEEIIEYLLSKSSEKPDEKLVITDLRTKTSVSHRDIGVGISQVLPVLVSAYASKNAVIAIEQPELHLHPALQSEIADVFIETVKENNNTYLIETHSEHLLLRIMRRIREKEISPNDINLLFVNVDNDYRSSFVQELRISESGKLLDHWPGGFFEERFIDKGFGIEQ